MESREEFEGATTPGVLDDCAWPPVASDWGRGGTPKPTCPVKASWRLLL